MTSDQVGLFAVLALMLATGALAGASRLPRTLKLLICLALVLRVIGSLARYLVLFHLYRGLGDAVTYYQYGVEYAQRFAAHDFSMFWDSSQWRSKWGTQFVNFPSGMVVSVIGQTMLGEFVVFSLLAFSGLVAFTVAFRRSYPEVGAARYARWIWLCPSLWFWPSSVGKESLMLFGFGFAVLGFVGRQGRLRWLPMLIGLFVVYSIRPQVAALFVLSGTMARWLSPRVPWSMTRIAQGVVIAVVGLGGVWYSLRSTGVGSFDADGVQSYMMNDPSRRVGGHSSIDALPLSPFGASMALVNVLLRPFPWETRNPMMLLSCLEIYVVWGLAWWRRRQLATVLANWRNDRLLTLALLVILLYSITLGLMLTNLGIISRQRIFLFPFLFLLLEAAPRASAVRRRSWSPSLLEPLDEVAAPAASLRRS